MYSLAVIHIILPTLFTVILALNVEHLSITIPSQAETLRRSHLTDLGISTWAHFSTPKDQVIITISLNTLPFNH